MKITDALKKYRYKKAECEISLARIKAYQEVLKSGNLHLLDYCTKRSNDIGMPRSNKIVSPVEEEVIAKDENETLTREAIVQWIDDEYDRLWLTRLEASQIEIALSSLTREERSIIEWKYMDKLNWYHIELLYVETYKKTLTAEALQKKNSIAIIKLSSILTIFYQKFGKIL